MAIIHHQLEFHVHTETGPVHVTNDIGIALHKAFAIAAIEGGAVLDVLAFSATAANKWEEGGADEYNLDPEASVFRRYRITVKDEGSIP